MAGIHKFIHKIQLKDREMVNTFERIHRETKIESVEPSEEGVILTFSTSEPYTVANWTTVLTFAGRVQDGAAIPNDGQTLQEMVGEE